VPGQVLDELLRRLAGTVEHGHGSGGSMF
jgi:hypothetical protein